MISKFIFDEQKLLNKYAAFDFHLGTRQLPKLLPREIYDHRQIIANAKLS